MTRGIKKIINGCVYNKETMLVFFLLNRDHLFNVDVNYGNYLVHELNTQRGVGDIEVRIGLRISVT